MAKENMQAKKFSVLDLIEWIGNKLPDPVTLFAIGALLVMLASSLADAVGWEVVQEMPRPVQEQVLDAGGQPVLDPETGQPQMQDVVDPETGKPVVEWKPTGEVFRPKNLLTREGVFWIFESMVTNFIKFPPLGVVLVGMLGIGVAERTGLLAAALKAFMLGLRALCEFVTPPDWAVADKILTPAMVFIGVMSSLATDAGYVVLPPLAAALYKSVGRSPLAGLAAVFAGVSAGFSANLLITGLEPMLAELTAMGANVIDTSYSVNPACNWWFMIGSTFLITLLGWFVTAAFVERRLNKRAPEDGGPSQPTDEELAEQQLKPAELRGLSWAFVGGGVFLAAALCLILIPGAPLHTYTMPETGDLAELWIAPAPDAELPADAAQLDDGTIVVPSDGSFTRWVVAIVPLLFFGFLIPGIAYGVAAGQIKSDKDLAKLMMDSMAAMAPIIVLAFVAGQFIFFFSYTQLDVMMAIWGGTVLGKAGLSPMTLIVAFILVTLVFNLFIGSMSAKYTLFAPIFVPMFMMVGISPELTQAAYRVGDSVSNIITPLNAYLVIILVFMQRYVPKGGMGTLVSTMFPYTVVFTIVWTAFLLLWMYSGLPLGIDGELWYDLNAVAG